MGFDSTHSCLCYEIYLQWVGLCIKPLWVVQRKYFLLIWKFWVQLSNFRIYHNVRIMLGLELAWCLWEILCVVWACVHICFHLNEIFPIPVFTEVIIWVTPNQAKKKSQLKWVKSVAVELEIVRNSHSLYAEY